MRRGARGEAASKKNAREANRAAPAKSKSKGEDTQRVSNRRVRPKPAPAAPAEPRPSLRERLGVVRALGAKLRRPAEIVLRTLIVAVVGGWARWPWVASSSGTCARRRPSRSAPSSSRATCARAARSSSSGRASRSAGTSSTSPPEEAEERLSAHPWIAEAHVTRRLPGSYEIEVRERRAVALLALGEVFLVAEDGAVFKRAEDGDPIDLPVITGVERERFLRDRAFRTSILLEAVALLHDYRGAGLARREPIGELHVERDDGLSLYVGEDATYVRLGHGPFRPKLRRLRTVLDELGRRGARAEYVYLDNERRPDRVTVRVREPDEGSTAAAAAPSPPG
ncbi:MAG: cell division protein FtsQ/DivIB [Sandaracinaceae bacterium]|nr:cell division protein FtsQ/DivIB [Sandaracinaceae bacterium]